MSYCSNLTINKQRDIFLEFFNEFILIISRNRKTTFELIDENDKILKMKFMSERYALTLFRKKFKNENNENEILKLLRNLNYMSLTINQIAAYIRQRTSRVTISKYLKSFRRNEKNRASLLNNVIWNRRLNEKTSNFVVATWQISFEYIQTSWSSIVKLLSLMSFFDRQKTFEKLIMSRYKEIDNIVNFEKNIEMLRNYSLIALSVNNDVFEMHRLM